MRVFVLILTIYTVALEPFEINPKHYMSSGFDQSWLSKAANKVLFTFFKTHTYRQKRPSTAAPNVHLLSDSFYMPQVDRYRAIWVYLPPDYEENEKKYPVLYMQDGQNLFDEKLSFAGEWQVDESLNELFATTGQGAIVVGIANGEAYRTDEYSAWKHPQYGGGEGKPYADFIVNTLKPYIDNRFRTLPEREATGIMGSSMGGLIALYTALEYPEIFGIGGIFSPSLWFSDELWAYLGAHTFELPIRWYLLGGIPESETMASDLEKLAVGLKAAGYESSFIQLKLHPDGQHREWYWAREFPAAFQWLYKQAIPEK